MHVSSIVGAYCKATEWYYILHCESEPIVYTIRTMLSSFTRLLQLLELFEAGKDNVFTCLLYLSCEKDLVKDSVYLDHS